MAAATREIKFKVNGKDFTKTAKQAGSLSRGIGGIAKKLFSMKAALGAIVGVVASRALLNFGKNFIQSIGDIEGVSNAFDNMVKSAGGVADVMLGKVRDALNGTVSDLEIMRNVNQAINLGLPATADQMAELADIAQNLGRAVGRGPVLAFQDLVLGIGRQSRMILDNLGIVVDSVKAYEDYAAILGKSASELTEAEKKQAFFNATIEQGRGKMASMGKEQLTTGEKLAQLTASWDNWVKDLKLAIAESGALEQVFALVRDVMQEIMDLVNSNPDFLKGLFEQAISLARSLFEIIKGLIPLLNTMLDIVTPLLPLIGLAGKGIALSAKYSPAAIIGGALGGDSAPQQTVNVNPNFNLTIQQDETVIRQTFAQAAEDTISRVRDEKFKQRVLDERFRNLGLGGYSTV